MTMQPDADLKERLRFLCRITLKEFVGLPLVPSAKQVIYDIKSVLPHSDGSL